MQSNTSSKPILLVAPRIPGKEINGIMKRTLSLILLLLCLAAPAFSQTVPPEVQDELDKLGVEEDEVIQKLQEKGIDVNNIDPNDLPEVEQALKEVMAELEEEKAKEAALAGQQAPATIGIDTNKIQQALDTNKQVKPDTLKPGPAAPDKNAAQSDKGKADEAVEKPKASKDELPAADIFGHHLFRDATKNVKLDAQNVKAPPTYVLGPGDEISVSIFGPSQASFSEAISLDGYIKPAGMPRIYLKGITLGSARELLRRRFSEYYSFSPNEFEVAVTYSRVITINVVGEVFTPGSISIPATNTAFNALQAVGGPTDIGSVRNIKLLRNGEPARVFDVYEFLQDPTVEGNFYLQDNDYIHVPIYEKLVSIDGAVRKPFKYELKESEGLRQLVDYAGGFKENAFQGNIQIFRVLNDEEKILNVNFRELVASNTDFTIYSGDSVAVAEISRPYENFVELAGAVEFPGRYELEPGMRVGSLAGKGRLLTEARTDVAYLFRTREDETVQMLRVDFTAARENPGGSADLVLQPKDKLQIFSQVTYVDKASLSSIGALREPTEISYDPTENIKVSDLILLSGGLEPNAAEYGYIKRVDPANKVKLDFIRVNLFDVVSDTSSVENRTLKPFDQLIVYTNEQFFDEANVVVTGAVRQPGEYEFDDGLRVSDVIFFSDGLKPEATDFAYINRINLETQEPEYIRVDLKAALDNPNSPENVLLKPFDKVDVMSKITFIDETTVSVSGSVRVPGEYKYDETLTLKDALTMAGGLSFGAASNRVEVSRVVIRNNEPTQTVVAIIEVDDQLNPVSGQGAAFQLQPYDEIIVRNVPEFKLQQNVVIEGEVRYPGTHPLLGDNERLSSLIQRAGGLTEEAFAEGATLYRPKDGVGYIVMDLKEALKNEKSRFNYILKPGDVISLPVKKDFVAITGATKAQELYTQEILKDGKLTVPFHKGKRARFYVSKYAAGIGKDGKASKITVVHPNGEVKKTKNFGLFLIYPKVRKGSQINVGKKEEKEQPEGAPTQKEEIDWGKVVADSIAQATAILSLILLIQKVN